MNDRWPRDVASWGGTEWEQCCGQLKRKKEGRDAPCHRSQEGKGLLNLLYKTVKPLFLDVISNKMCAHCHSQTDSGANSTFIYKE